MDPFGIALLAGVLALPFHLVVRREIHEIRKLTDPRHLRTQAVVITDEEALDECTTPIGLYMGRSIWERIIFKGVEYRFDRVAPQVGPFRDRRLGPGELLLESDLVYVTE